MPFINKQRGFIQNLIIPGVILLGAVMAGMAYMSGSPKVGSDNEKASMMAAALITQGEHYATAVLRAEADGALAGLAGGSYYQLEGTPVVQNGYTSTQTARLPPGFMPGAARWIIARKTIRGMANGSHLGTSAYDDMIFVHIHSGEPLIKEICARINNRIAGTSLDPNANPGQQNFQATNITNPGFTGAPTGTVHGCMKDLGVAGNQLYYRMVNIR